MRSQSSMKVGLTQVLLVRASKEWSKGGIVHSPVFHPSWFHDTKGSVGLSLRWRRRENKYGATIGQPAFRWKHIGSISHSQRRSLGAWKWVHRLPDTESAHISRVYFKSHLDVRSNWTTKVYNTVAIQSHLNVPQGVCAPGDFFSRFTCGHPQVCALIKPPVSALDNMPHEKDLCMERRRGELNWSVMIQRHL